MTNGPEGPIYRDRKRAEPADRRLARVIYFYLNKATVPAVERLLNFFGCYYHIR